MLKKDSYSKVNYSLITCPGVLATNVLNLPVDRCLKQVTQATEEISVKFDLLQCYILSILSERMTASYNVGKVMYCCYLFFSVFSSLAV